jgi:hypothetical protein
MSWYLELCKLTRCDCDTLTAFFHTRDFVALWLNLPMLENHDSDDIMTVADTISLFRIMAR